MRGRNSFLQPPSCPLHHLNADADNRCSPAGLLGVGLSLCWMLQVVLYLFVYPPVTPFLNVLFIKLDDVFPLFGVIAFALFCFWLLGESMLGDLLHLVWLLSGAIASSLLPAG